MKKLTMAFTFIAFLGTITLTSCSSEKNCECTIEDSNGNQSGDKQSITIEDGDCNLLDQSVAKNSITCVEK